MPPRRHSLDAQGDMLEALGIPSQALPQSAGARSGLLRSLLSERQVLIVLDNARDYQQVEPLLPGTGPSRVIITSRHQMPALTVFHQARPVHWNPSTTTRPNTARRRPRRWPSRRCGSARCSKSTASLT